MARYGLVSDTHGLVEPRLAPLFEGCERLLHAGDVVGASVLEALSRLAPLDAVRGNNDVSPDVGWLPSHLVVPVGELSALVLHELGKPARPVLPARRLIESLGVQIVVYGHSHQPAVEVRGGVLYVNPGSAGPRRFRLPRTAGILEVEGRTARVEIRDLQDPALPVLIGPVEARLGRA
jgi:putative phosphoesterase